ncbi:MAG: translational GTPase TypA [Clostridia bacterium]|nr:translational GTPase TypA [Clostridia bacterium]MBP5767041.1 translational GTPase TypA [Clostridia bacterium]
MVVTRNEIRNIAIIAHVDHGKTTLVDGMLRQSGIFRSNEVVAERVMDSNDIERERGITILSKNTSVKYKDTTINIVDTPGHADFGGEVERVLGLCDGVLLLVDAFEGAMPQTRFVLSKALAMKLKPIVVVNKIDRDGARPTEVLDEVFELFMDLGADDSQLDFPVVYASARNGYASLTPDGGDKKDLEPLFESILKYIPAPEVDLDAPFRMLISNVTGDDYVGRTGVARIDRGVLKNGSQVAISSKGRHVRYGKVNYLYKFLGLKKVEVEEAVAGDIVVVAGLSDINIGDTVSVPDCIEPIDFVNIDEPTLSMNFSVNNSPFAGREGEYVTSRHVRDRLFRELETNVSLKVEETDSPDTFKVSGRGELHLTVLIENMRREGYEFQVSRPKVIFKEVDGLLYEPMERLTVDTPDDTVGVVIEKIGLRKGEMLDMHPGLEGYVRLEFKIPSRGLIGYRNEFMTDTKGNGIMNHLFDGYEEYKGDMNQRTRGSMIAWETGESVVYGLFNAQERGKLFIGAGVKVYEGMIVGENARPDDIVINVCKKKHVSNVRASGSDEALRLTPPVIMSLEQAIEFIADDELMEVTPKNIRLRKKILDTELRAKANSKLKKA